jgi:hypothetical protein
MLKVITDKFLAAAHHFEAQGMVIYSSSGLPDLIKCTLGYAVAKYPTLARISFFILTTFAIL